MLHRHLADELPRARPPGRGGDTRRRGDEARRLGGRRLIGEYRPTAKNGMVKEHYAKLGFAPLDVDADGNKRDQLDLAGYSTCRSCYGNTGGLCDDKPISLLFA